MRRILFFNNEARELVLEQVERKVVHYYIRKKLAGENKTYIQKKRDGRVFCYKREMGTYTMAQITITAPMTVTVAA